MPGRVRPRVAMQQQDGWPRAAMTHPKGYVTNVDEVECESLEHRVKLTVWPARQFTRPSRGRAPSLSRDLLVGRRPRVVGVCLHELDHLLFPLGEDILGRRVEADEDVPRIG